MVLIFEKKCSVSVTNDKIHKIRSFFVVQWVKYPALSLQQLRSLLWHGMIPGLYLYIHTQKINSDFSFEEVAK